MIFQLPSEHVAWHLIIQSIGFIYFPALFSSIKFKQGAGQRPDLFLSIDIAMIWTIFGCRNILCISTSLFNADVILLALLHFI